mgnify:CR=1 FL=1
MDNVTSRTTTDQQPTHQFWNFFSSHVYVVHERFRFELKKKFFFLQNWKILLLVHQWMLLYVCDMIMIAVIEKVYVRVCVCVWYELEREKKKGHKNLWPSSSSKRKFFFVFSFVSLSCFLVVIHVPRKKTKLDIWSTLLGCWLVVLVCQDIWPCVFFSFCFFHTHAHAQYQRTYIWSRFISRRFSLSLSCVVCTLVCFWILINRFFSWIGRSSFWSHTHTHNDNSDTFQKIFYDLSGLFFILFFRFVWRKKNVWYPPTNNKNLTWESETLA